MTNRGRGLLYAALFCALSSLAWIGCGGGDSAEGAPGKSRAPAGKTGRGGGAPGGPRGADGGPGGGGSTAVPVRVADVERRTVSSFLETNGTLEAENEVDIVSRIQGPIVELAVEEGMRVEKGQLLLRIDETEPRAQLEIAKVALQEATRTYERARASLDNEIISQELYDQALAQYESAQAQVMGNQILFDYTRVKAPFDAVVVERVVKLAQSVTANQKLLRISDFDPLLCPIQVPEKELSRLRAGQRAMVSVEAWPDEQFQARVLRISPIVDSTTGTIKVTLQVSGRGKLSPGMFANVFLVVDTHENAIVMPKRALSLESLTDMVFVAKDGVAERRDVELGFEEDEYVEVLSGLAAGDRVIVVGQDGLTESTPVQVLDESDSVPEDPTPSPSATTAEAKPDPRAGRSRQAGERGGRPNLSEMTPEQIERMKSRMRERGMSEEEIDEAIRRRRERSTRN